MPSESTLLGGVVIQSMEYNRISTMGGFISLLFLLLLLFKSLPVSNYLVAHSATNAYLFLALLLFGQLAVKHFGL